MNPRRALAIAVLLSAPALSVAQPAVPDAQARAAFERGVTDVDAGRFASAVDAFEESYRLRPVAVVLFNLAGAYTRLGRHQQAIATYERYLIEGGAHLPPERVQSVRARITELRRDLPVVTLHIRPTPFSLTVDGRPHTVTGADVTLDPGDHLLTVSAPSHTALQRDVHLGPGARITWDAELAATVTAPAPAPVVVFAAPAPVRVAATPHPPPVAPDAPAITSRWWFWTGLGVLAVGGTVLALGLSGSFDYTQAPVTGTAYDVAALRF